MLSWQLTLIAVLAGPPSYYVIRKLGKSMHKASRKALESWSLMLAVLAKRSRAFRGGEGLHDGRFRAAAIFPGESPAW